MVGTVDKLNKFIEIGKKIRYYRDKRVNPKFVQQEKPSVISFIRDEETETILKEDNLYDNASVKELLDLRDLIIFDSFLSNEALEEIDFSLLLNGSSDDLLLLRVYKKIDLLCAEAEIKNIVSERFTDLIREYVGEEFSLEELEVLKREHGVYDGGTLQTAYEDEVDDTVINFIIKKKVQSEILSSYVFLLGSHLESLDSDSDEYKDICKFIYNLFFVNKDLERVNESLYNQYAKLVPLDLDSLGLLHGCSRNLVEGIRKDTLFDCYDYGVELLFRKPKFNNDVIFDLVGIYLDTIQSLLSSNDIDTLFTIVDDNYMVNSGSSGKYSNSDKIKADLENRIYINEERYIRGKTYIKGTKNG